MAVKSSGTFLKFSEIASEFSDSQPHQMSEFTRGGSLVPDNASNANITSVAARGGGGADGQMKFSDYYGAANTFGITIASNTTDVDLATLMNAAQSGVWASSEPKTLTINSGVIVGATSVSNAALTITSGMGGTLTIINNGAIQGAGGSANGGNGGDAVQASSSNVTFTNNGDIYAGGGGGGQGGAGGTGGQGSQTTTTHHYGIGQLCVGRGGSCSSSSYNQGCANVFNSPNAYCAGGSSAVITRSCSLLCQCNDCNTDTTTITSGGSGGSGGAGGVGQGYNQSAGSGSAGAAGSAGGTNAGAGGSGGTGGNGGSFGTSGSSGATGNTGANGNHSNGSAGSGGSGGGAAGDYISGLSNLTFTNNGNVAGTTS